MLGMIDLGVFKGFVTKELDDEEIIIPVLHKSFSLTRPFKDLGPFATCSYDPYTKAQ